MNNNFITGSFRSSFSTVIIGRSEFPVVDFRAIELRGRKILIDAEFLSEEPLIADSDLILNQNYVSNIEIFPKIGLIFPLDKPKKLNLTEVKILNPYISHQFDIEGFRHGIIEGLLYAKFCEDKPQLILGKTEEIKSRVDSVVNNEDSTIDEFNKSTNSGCLSFGVFNRSLINNSKSANSSSVLPTNSGCLTFFKSGCLSLFFMLLLLGFIFSMIKSCSENSQKNKVKNEIVETDENKSDDFIEDNRRDDKIEYSDSSAQDNKAINKIRTILLPNVQFYTNNSVLLPSSKKDLDHLAVYLLENQDLNAKVIGHTDNVGKFESNILLSQQRANAVKTYLINTGIESNRINATGKGSSEPKASNESEEGRLMNRRVEVELINVK